MKNLWRKDHLLLDILRKCSAVAMDQALEKECNKVAKGKGVVIGFSKRKGTVDK